MGNVVVLDENTANKIAAGEVVERPASVVKELIENSIDAGATMITVEIKNGGISYIRVTDNGSGIANDDAVICFERHATSKIRSSDDLERISTMGFRGEALASIAAVAKVELTTRTRNSDNGYKVIMEGGQLKQNNSCGCPVGTSFIIRDLFFNTPARYKFLKKDSTEAGYVSDLVGRAALGNPQISFKLNSGGSTILHTPGNNDVLSSIYSVYGKDTARDCLEVNYEDKSLRITGYVGKPTIARANRNFQSIYINRRYIKSKLISAALDEAYSTFLMKNRFPFAVLNIEVNPAFVDVNVHPTKMEVRFSDDQQVFRAIYHAVNTAVNTKPAVPEFEFKREKDSFAIDDNSFNKYEQQKLINKRESLIEPSQIKENDAVIIKKEVCNKDLDICSPLVKEDTADKALKASDDVITTSHDDKVQNMQNDQIKDSANVNVQDKSLPRSSKEDKEDEFAEGLLQAKIVGQVFLTYILLEYKNEMILIDQHAAHERLQFERLKEKWKNKENLCQQLLSPVVLELTYQEIKKIFEQKQSIKNLGFEFEDFGNNSLLIRGVPMGSDPLAAKELFKFIVDKLEDARENWGEKVEGVLYTIACKSAIKANKKMDEIEIRSLLKNLANYGSLMTCPHGRPIAVRLTKYELEKKFKRIV